ncbi:MAG: D-alanyl-D-alanine carboxypeptidase, partial [Clostridia bacterium]|nr:D-alanyl-D-alanine carboxypeptidase [Clostridia bacterium]
MKKNCLATILLALVMSVNSVAFATGSATGTSTSQSASTEEKKKTEFPVPNADSAIVLDVKSGDVIYALDADKKVYPAGLTNLMTATLALESKSLNDTFQVTKDTLSGITYDQPQLGLLEGETYTIEQLIHAVILNSNNDASNALAIATAGSIDEFVKKMNEKAKDLGLDDTNFVNPSGYHNENHYTTASDMAYLAKYALQNQEIATIAKTQKYTFPPTGVRTSEKTILSTNHLVSRYKYPYHYYANATGLKSGNSTEAGYCLAATAVKNGFTVLSVIMGAPNQDANEKAYSFRDTAAIFDYVFDTYQSVVLAKKGDVIHDSKVDEAKNSTRLALTVEED